MESNESRKLGRDVASYLVRFPDRGDVDIQIARGGRASINGRKCEFGLTRISDSLWSLIIDGEPFEIYLALALPPGLATTLSVNGTSYELTVFDQRALIARSMTSAVSPGTDKVTIRAPMPGLIVAVEVETGRQVKPGDGLLILEAMKMENELRSNYSGMVEELRVKPGMKVEKGEVMIILNTIR